METNQRTAVIIKYFKDGEIYNKLRSFLAFSKLDLKLYDTTS